MSEPGRHGPLSLVSFGRMLSPLSLALLGLMLGIRHAVDPDHVVAVSTIATRETSLKHAARIGAMWGVGHTMTIMMVGGAIILLRIAIPPRVGLAMEFSVALMLIVLGLVNLFARRDSDRPSSNTRPLVIGMVHGLAGSAAVSLLVLATVRDAKWALAYLLLFGFGTIAGMIVTTVAIAWPASYAVARASSSRRWLSVASGMLSLVFGIVLAAQLGVGDGLFAPDPRWTPR